MNYEVKIFSKFDDQVKKYWKDLDTQSYCYCFQSYEWFENWVVYLQKYRKNNSPCIVVVLEGSKVLCILPFEIEKNFNLKILKWAGGKYIDYGSPVLNKNYALNKNDFILLWKKIIKLIPEIDLIYLNNQPEYIDNIKNPFVFFLKNHKYSKMYSITLPKTWKEYTNEILKKDFLAQNLRKKKQLRKLGNLRFKIVYDQIEKNKYMDELIVQKNARLLSQGIEDIFNSEDLNFYKGFENKNFKTIKTHVSSLILNGELIAIHWGVIYKKRFYYLLLSMKEGNLRRYSPGRLLISFLIRWSITKKLQIFDFTLGDEEYKKNWSNNQKSLFSLIQLNSFNGFFLYLLIKIKLILKSIDKKNYLSKFIFAIKKTNVK